MKPISVEGSSFINILVSNKKKKQTKDPFNLWMESTLSLKAILFLTFQIVKKMHRGLFSKLSCTFYPQGTHSNPKELPKPKKEAPKKPQKE